MKEKFCIYSKTENIHGTIYTPNITSKILIICHGFGGGEFTNSHYPLLFENCLNTQCAIVSFNFRGAGEQSNEIYSYTFNDWISDLNNIICYIKRKLGIYPIHILGISAGTWVGIRYCLNNSDISSLICIAPVLSHHIGMNSEGGPIKIYLKNKNLTKKIINFNSKKVTLSFFNVMLETEPCADMNDFKTPTFFLYGENDNPWRKADAILGYEILKKNNISTHIQEIRNGDHCLLNTNVQPPLSNLIVDWISKY
ncbi:alpha/beta hydrolase [Bacillus cereus]|nr:alpha/beta hydrolase [Bacillus cereus]